MNKESTNKSTTMSNSGGNNKGKVIQLVQYSDSDSDDEETREQILYSSPNLPPGVCSSSRNSESLKKIEDLDSNIEKEAVIQAIKKLKGESSSKYSSAPPVPSGVSPQDLSSVHGDYVRHGEQGNFWDYVKQQQDTFLHHEQAKNLSQASLFESSEQPQEEAEGDSDSENEEYIPREEVLICDLNIDDAEYLVIPQKKTSNHFPNLTVEPPNTEKTLQLTDPHNKEWEMTLSFHKPSHNYIITKGWNLYLEGFDLSVGDTVQFFLPKPQPHANYFHIKHRVRHGQLLFEVTVPRCNRLPIPYDLAKRYLHPPSKPSPYLKERALVLIDLLNLRFNMKYICNEDEKAYIFLRGWKNLVAHFGINHGDKIQFFKMNRKRNFLITHERGPVKLEYVCPPFSHLNIFVCKVELTVADVECRRLQIPGVKRNAFKCREKDMVKLTDENRKNWQVMIVYQNFHMESMIIDGWEDIVWEHKLKTGDIVRFSVPFSPDHDRHFLIECVKK